MPAKKGWTIGKTRSVLYKTGRVLGDVNAIKSGKIGRRVTNRALGKVSTRLSTKLSRGFLNLFK